MRKRADFDDWFQSVGRQNEGSSYPASQIGVWILLVLSQGTHPSTGLLSAGLEPDSYIRVLVCCVHDCFCMPFREGSAMNLILSLGSTVSKVVIFAILFDW